MSENLCYIKWILSRILLRNIVSWFELYFVNSVKIHVSCFLNLSAYCLEAHSMGNWVWKILVNGHGFYHKRFLLRIKQDIHRIFQSLWRLAGYSTALLPATHAKWQGDIAFLTSNVMGWRLARSYYQAFYRWLNWCGPPPLPNSHSSCGS